ncbi:hypothetical protein QM467_18645 [Rhodoblastus sp. 17X3]|uniref:hypothetical protein n=1 Tax=Rhodoblastus sp. 17X3 TaxID=3047026 RepID=UPI0024B7701C|nr:hypothetical protein [Rhodoblastus sp. 17X3]MDI9850058.1 hypothetical protein [Rhodoblastus sp. 17X3]
MLHAGDRRLRLGLNHEDNRRRPGGGRRQRRRQKIQAMRTAQRRKRAFAAIVRLMVRTARRLICHGGNRAIIHGAVCLASGWRKEKSHDRESQEHSPDNPQDPQVSGPLGAVSDGRVTLVAVAASGLRYFRQEFHSRTLRNRAALVITLTEDKAMAAAAIIGDSKIPNNG